MKTTMQYSVGDEVVHVPSNEADEFNAVAKSQNDTPEPIFSYRVINKAGEAQQVDVPKAEYDEFAKVAETNGDKIEPLRMMTMDDGTERFFSARELRDFMRSDEYLNSTDGAADKKRREEDARQIAEMEAKTPGFWSELGRRMFTAEGIRETAEDNGWAKPYAYANDLANSLVGGLLKGGAKINQAFGYLWEGVGNALDNRGIQEAGRSIQRGADADTAAIDRNLPTDMLDTQGGGAVNKVLNVGKGVASVTGEFAPALIPGVGQAYAASLVGGGATQRYMKVYDDAIAHGCDPERAVGLASLGATVDAAQNMFLMGKFKGIWSGEQATLAQAAKEGLVRRLVKDTLKTGATMSAGGMAGDVIDQAAEGAYWLDYKRTAKVGFDQFIEGGLFHLVNTGAHNMTRIGWGSETKGIPAGAARDMMETPEGRALIFSNSPDAARAIFRARKNGEHVSRRMIEELGLSGDTARTAADRDALGDRLLSDYTAWKERIRTRMDDVQASALADEIASRSEDGYDNPGFEKVWFKAVESIKDAQEIDDPARRKEIVDEALKATETPKERRDREAAVKKYNEERAAEDEIAKKPLVEEPQDYPVGTVIQRADGKQFVRQDIRGSYNWVAVDKDTPAEASKQIMETAMQGGHRVISQPEAPSAPAAEKRLGPEPAKPVVIKADLTPKTPAEAPKTHPEAPVEAPKPVQPTESAGNPAPAKPVDVGPNKETTVAPSAQSAVSERPATEVKPEKPVEKAAPAKPADAAKKRTICEALEEINSLNEEIADARKPVSFQPGEKGQAEREKWQKSRDALVAEKQSRIDAIGKEIEGLRTTAKPHAPFDGKPNAKKAAKVVDEFVSKEKDDKDKSKLKRPELGAPYHDKDAKMVVSTNGRMLIATKHGFDPNAKNEASENSPRGGFPNWKVVIPADGTLDAEVEINPTEVAKSCKQVLALSRSLHGKNDTPPTVALKFGNLVYEIDAEYMGAMCRAMEANGITKISGNSTKFGPIMARNKDTTVVVMPRRRNGDEPITDIGRKGNGIIVDAQTGRVIAAPERTDTITQSRKALKYEQDGLAKYNAEKIDYARKTGLYEAIVAAHKSGDTDVAKIYDEASARPGSFEALRPELKDKVTAWIKDKTDEQVLNEIADELAAADQTKWNRKARENDIARREKRIADEDLLEDLIMRGDEARKFLGIEKHESKVEAPAEESSAFDAMMKQVNDWSDGKQGHQNPLNSIRLYADTHPEITEDDMVAAVKKLGITEEQLGAWLAGRDRSHSFNIDVAIKAFDNPKPETGADIPEETGAPAAESRPVEKATKKRVMQSVTKQLSSVGADKATKDYIRETVENALGNLDEADAARLADAMEKAWRAETAYVDEDKFVNGRSRKRNVMTPELRRLLDERKKADAELAKVQEEIGIETDGDGGWVFRGKDGKAVLSKTQKANMAKREAEIAAAKIVDSKFAFDGAKRVLSYMEERGMRDVDSVLATKDGEVIFLDGIGMNQKKIVINGKTGEMRQYGHNEDSVVSVANATKIPLDMLKRLMKNGKVEVPEEPAKPAAAGDKLGTEIGDLIGKHLQSQVTARNNKDGREMKADAKSALVDRLASLSDEEYADIKGRFKSIMDENGLDMGKVGEIQAIFNAETARRNGTKPAESAKSEFSKYLDTLSPFKAANVLKTMTKKIDFGGETGVKTEQELVDDAVKNGGRLSAIYTESKSGKPQVQYTVGDNIVSKTAAEYARARGLAEDANEIARAGERMEMKNAIDAAEAAMKSKGFTGGEIEVPGDDAALERLLATGRLAKPLLPEDKKLSETLSFIRDSRRNRGDWHVEEKPKSTITEEAKAFEREHGVKFDENTRRTEWMPGTFGDKKRYFDGPFGVEEETMGALAANGLRRFDDPKSGIEATKEFLESGGDIRTLPWNEFPDNAYGKVAQAAGVSDTFPGTNTIKPANTLLNEIRAKFAKEPMPLLKTERAPEAVERLARAVNALDKETGRTAEADMKQAIEDGLPFPDKGEVAQIAKYIENHELRKAFESNMDEWRKFAESKSVADEATERAEAVDAAIAEEEAGGASGRPDAAPSGRGTGALPQDEPMPQGTTTTGKVNGIVTPQSFLKEARKLFPDVAIRQKNTTRMKKWAAGHFEGAFRVIRSRDMNAIRTITHELGHDLEYLTRYDLARTPAAKRDLSDLGHQLYPTPGPKPNSYIGEGFAEYIRGYICNAQNLSQVAPDMDAWFRGDFKAKHPEIVKKIDRLRDMVQTMKEQSAADTLRGFRHPATTTVERAWKKVGEFFSSENWNDSASTILKGMKKSGIDKLYHWQDEFRELEAAVKAGNTAKAQQLAASVSDKIANHPYLFPTITRGTASQRVMDMARYGTTNLIGNRKTGESLKDIFADFSHKEQEAWKDYAIARHGLENYYAKGLEFGMPKEVLEKVVQQYDSPKFQQALQRVTDYSHRILHLGVDSGLISQETYDKIVAEHPIYIRITRRKADDGAGTRQGGAAINKRTGGFENILDPIDAMLMDQEKFMRACFQAKSMQLIVGAANRAKAANMASIKRNGGPNTSTVNPKDQSHIAVGAYWPIEVPNAQEKVQFGAGKLKQGLSDLAADYSNRTGEDIIPLQAFIDDLATHKDAAGRVAQLSIFHDKPSQGKHNLVSVYVDGKLHTYELPDMKWANMLTDVYDKSDFNWLERGFGLATAGIRLGATTINPGFAVRNGIRDSLHSAVMSESGALPMLGSLNGMLNQLTGREAAQMFRAMGGHMSDLVGITKEQKWHHGGQVALAQNPLQSLQAYGALDWAMMKPVIKATSDVLSIPELGPRIREFNGILHKCRAAGLNEDVAAMLAMSHAKDISIDFQRAGRFMKHINHFIPFSNAMWRGSEQTFRNLGFIPALPHQFEDRNAVRGAKNIGKGLAYVTSWMATLAMLEMSGDEKQKQAAFERDPVEKWEYAHVGDWRIPLPFELGFIFGAIPQAAIYEMNGDEGAMKECLKAFNQAMPSKYASPDTAIGSISLFTPWIGLLRNKDYRERSIVPEHIMDNRVKEDWYTQYTTELSKKIGKFTGQSPAQLEYLLDAYTGGLYRRVALASENLGDQSRLAEGRGISIIDTLRARPQANRLVSDFYKFGKEAKQKLGSGVLSLEDYGKFASMNGVKEELTERFNEMRAIRADKTIPLAEQDKRVQAIAEELNETIRTFNARDDYRRRGIAYAASHLTGSTPESLDDETKTQYMKLLENVPTNEIVQALIGFGRETVMVKHRGVPTPHQRWSNRNVSERVTRLLMLMQNR